MLSAAVVPDEAAALNHKFQNWPVWVKESLLDAVCPMAYTPDSRIFRTPGRAGAVLGCRRGRRCGRGSEPTG